MSELSAALLAARNGQGTAVVVEGAAGTGKSSMLAALTDSVPREFRVVSARGSELELDNPFGVIRRLFEGPLEFESGFRALEEIFRLADNLSQQAPLLIVVDDLHWVDAKSLRALGYLANRIDDRPIVLAVALRRAEQGASEDLLDAVCAHPRAIRLTTSPLTADEVTAVVREKLPAADDRVAEACLEATAGNPFYLNELLAHIGDEGTAADVRAATLPHLGDRVLRRVGRLGPDADALVRTAAVLVDGARLEEVARIAGLARAAAATAASRLQRIEILGREDPVEFRQPLVRRSVHAALSVTDRERAQMAVGGASRSGRLTRSEVRVVRLVAEGLSNEDIAAKLFVSVKTVETHLTHAYAKLELSGPRVRWRLVGLVRANTTDFAVPASATA